MNTHEDKPSVRTDIMDAISRGKIKMRPRWHFILLSALTITGAFIVFLTLLYVASLGVFFLRDSGVLHAPSFGMRGWWVLARSIPWLLVLFLLLFVVVLELLVRRYTFVYKKPLLVSVFGILLIILTGGFAIAQTPFHRQIALEAREGMLPPPVGFWYRAPLRMPRPPDTYHGNIISIIQGGFVMVDEDDAGTTTVLLSPRTRLPYGEDFSPGERIIVVGDAIATGTVQAFGIEEIEE